MNVHEKTLMEMDGKDALAVSAEEGQILRDIVIGAVPKTIVEVGTGHGYSTTWMMMGMMNDCTLYTIDETVRPHIFQQPEFKNGRTIEFLHGKLDHKYEELPSQIDLIFLDSQHLIDDIRYDIEILAPRLKNKGHVIVHDTVYCPDMELFLCDYFLGLNSLRMKAADIKPSKLKWHYRHLSTKYGLGVATKMGKGTS